MDRPCPAASSSDIGVVKFSPRIIPRSRFSAPGTVVSKRVSYLSIQRCLVTGGQVLNHLSKTWAVNVWGGGTGELSSQVRKQSPVIFGWVVDGVHEGVRHSARPTVMLVIAEVV